MTKRCMVDIETLGKEPGSVILSIGAVIFDEEGVRDTFSVEIDKVDCEKKGLSIGAETLDWWLGQPDGAKEVLSEGGKELTEALFEFASFYGDCDEIWANSPRFDCEHLRKAYNTVGVDVPWELRDERDFRTLKSLPGATAKPEGGNYTEHDALSDARWQARVAVRNLYDE